MPTATSRESGPDDIPMLESLSSREQVRGNVLAALGRPPELHAVDVRLLWENYYRVNVLVGPERLTARIAYSYFLRVGLVLLR